MKATKEFEYHVDGNHLSTFKPGDDVPEIAHAYAIKNGFCEKAKPAPQNKAKQETQRQVKTAK